MSFTLNLYFMLFPYCRHPLVLTVILKHFCLSLGIINFQLKNMRKMLLAQKQTLFRQIKNLSFLTRFLLLIMKPGAVSAVIW